MLRFFTKEGGTAKPWRKQETMLRVAVRLTKEAKTIIHKASEHQKLSMSRFILKSSLNGKHSSTQRPAKRNPQS